MAFTYDEDVFSDLYKDTHGFRPRNHRFYADDTTPEEKQAMWDELLVEHDEEMTRYHEAQNEAVVRFETLLADTIAAGAADKQTALKWLMDAEEDEYVFFDHGYFEYTYHLPYGYLKGILA